MLNWLLNQCLLFRIICCCFLILFSFQFCCNSCFFFFFRFQLHCSLFCFFILFRFQLRCSCCFSFIFSFQLRCSLFSCFNILSLINLKLMLFSLFFSCVNIIWWPSFLIIDKVKHKYFIALSLYSSLFLPELRDIW